MAYSTGDNHKMRLLFDCSVTVFISLGNCLFNFDNLFNFNVFQNQENVCFFYMQLRMWRKWRYYWLHIHWLEEPSFWMCTSMPGIAHKISPYSVKLQHSAVKSGCLFSVVLLDLHCTKHPPEHPQSIWLQIRNYNLLSP